MRSLTEILLWWHPGTNAPIEERLAALDEVLTIEPEIGWELLEKLLPGTTSSFSSPTAKPRWRDFGEPPEDSRTRQGEINYASRIVERALDRLGSDPERWRVILSSLPFITTVQQEKALSLLKEIAGDGATAEVKTALWQILRDFVYQRRSFSEAQLSLSAEVLDGLERSLTRLAPEDPVECNRWLFDNWLPEVPSGTEDIKAHERELEELRLRAVAEVLRKDGIQGLARLGVSCRFPGFVTLKAVPLLKGVDHVLDFAQEALAEGDAGFSLAALISQRALEVHGKTWRELVLDKAQMGDWPATVTATLLLFWPNERSTWDNATELGEEVKTEYWRRKPVALLEGSPEDLTYEIDRLIEAGRGTEDLASPALQGTAIPSELLLKIFDAGFAELKAATTAEEMSQLTLNSHDISDFLDELRTRPDIPKKQLAIRELQALPLLGPRGRRELTLHEFMAQDPSFFVDVLCKTFLPAHRDKSLDTEPTPGQQARARAAFTLLESMQRIPGQSESGEIDETALLQWIDDVRGISQEKDREAIADLHIGKILAHSPDDPDDQGWPHRVVREVIERLAAEDIERGLMVERHNMRGVVRKALYEGGDKERDLAAKYRAWAELSHVRWPRMAGVLDMMADDWAEIGRREDARAEQDKLD